MAPEKKLTFLLLLLFILSRLPFINGTAVFFDSGEYLHLFSLPSFPQALFSGHFPLHIGYVVLGWPIYHISKFIDINPANAVILSQIFILAIALYCLYSFLAYLSDKKIALLTVSFISFTPLFWITNSTIMMENAYVSLFCFSLYFLAKFLKNNKVINLHFSALFFTFATLTHLLIILWLPFYLSIIYLKNRKKIIHVSLVLIFYLILFFSFDVLLISHTLGMPNSTVINYLFFSKQQEFVLSNPSFHNFLISIRNLLVLMPTNFTGLLVIFGLISEFYLIKKKSKLWITTLLWIAPAYLTSQLWDSLLPGRHGIIAAIGLSFLAAYFLVNRLKLAFIFIVYLFLVSIPTVILLKQPIPYLSEAKFVGKMSTDSLLIETHFAKPQVEATFKGKIMAVNQSGSENNIIDRQVKKYLQENKPIFISSGALSEPYGLYSGPYLHALTLSYFHDFQLKNIITNYTLKKYETISRRDNLYIYEITSTQPSAYPKIAQLKNSKKRIDYYDPISRALTYLIYR